MNRRQFFLGWTFQKGRASLEVEVMETFSGSGGPSVFLVHHVSEALRNAFAQWLRANNGARIVCRLDDGTKIDGRIFRVKLCFGRGLVLTSAPVAIRPKDVLIIDGSR